MGVDDVDRGTGDNITAGLEGWVMGVDPAVDPL